MMTLVNWKSAFKIEQGRKRQFLAIEKEAILKIKCLLNESLQL